MKKQNTTDVKRAAANDKPENGKKVKKVSKPTEPDAKFTLGSIDTVKRGFLLEFVKFVKAKGTVDAAMLIAEFSGRQIDGKKITVERVHRYISYCRNHGILKTVKAGGQ
jgi:hypothetical protein